MIPHARPGNDRMVSATQLGHLVAEVKRVLGLRVRIDSAITEPRIERAGEDMILRIPRAQVQDVPELADLVRRVETLESKVSASLTEDPYSG